MGLFDKLRNRTKAEAVKETKKSTKAPKKAAVTATKTAPTAITTHDVILTLPVVTEKSTIAQSTGKYSFYVAPRASKIAVGKAVAALYNVTVKKVNILNQSGKAVVRGRTVGKRKDVRKAIVTLAAGQTIAVFEPKPQDEATTKKKSKDTHNHDHADHAHDEKSEK